MKELGEYLKQTRIENSVSITEACEDLEFSTSHLENIESGNVKAFKDVYELKEAIRTYAKYLGLDSDKVMDEFNDFLFQHTSKISIEDIEAAQKKKEESKKVKSPYTKEYKEKVNLWPIVYVLVAVLVIVLIIYIVINTIDKTPNRVNELKAYKGDVVSYEFTNKNYCS